MCVGSWRGGGGGGRGEVTKVEPVRRARTTYFGLTARPPFKVVSKGDDLGVIAVCGHVARVRVGAKRPRSVADLVITSPTMAASAPFILTRLSLK